MYCRHLCAKFHCTAFTYLFIQIFFNDRIALWSSLYLRKSVEQPAGSELHSAMRFLNTTNARQCRPLGVWRICEISVLDRTSEGMVCKLVRMCSDGQRGPYGTLRRSGSSLDANSLEAVNEKNSGEQTLCNFWSYNMCHWSSLLYQLIAKRISSTTYFYDEYQIVCWLNHSPRVLRAAMR